MVTHRLKTAFRHSTGSRYIRFYKNFRLASIAATSALAVLLSLFLFPVVLKPETAEGTAGVVETPTLTMVVGHESANLDLIVNSSNGTFASTDSDNMAAFTVQTNNYTGYTLMVSAGDDEQELTNSSTGETLKSISSAVDADKFASSSETLNKWGYQPSKLNSSTNTDFLPAPTTTATIIDKTSSANTTANNYTIGLGARVDYTLASGTYTNTYILTATANPVAYAITFYDGINSKSIGSQSSEVNTAATITINPTYTSGSAPSRATYSFAGWCDQVPTADANNYFPATVCGGSAYQTGGSYNLDPTVNNKTLKLYAYWKPTTFEEAYAAAGVTTKVSNRYRMQDMTKNICNAVTINEVTQLVDNRSGNYVYYVAKLKDGKCWMTQNLRLGTNLAANTGTLRLYPSDSNISAAYYDLTNRLTSTKTPATPCEADSCEDRYKVATTYYYDGNAFFCAPTSGNNYVGCNYNWFTATAGTGTSNTTPGSSGYVDAISSICPKGWYLPTSGELTDRPETDLSTLASNYPSVEEMLVTGITTYDNTTGLPKPGLLLSGQYSQADSSPQFIGSGGIYWSRTAYSKGFAHYIYVNTTSIHPRHRNSKSHGESVRCLAYSS